MMKQKRTWWSVTSLLCCSVALLAWQPSASFARDIGGEPANIAQDFSSKGKGQAKGHAKGHAKARGAYAYQSRRAHSPYFCPPGQAKKPGLGSAHRC